MCVTIKISEELDVAVASEWAKVTSKIKVEMLQRLQV